MEYLGCNIYIYIYIYVYIYIYIYIYKQAFYEHCHWGGLHMINQPAPCCQNWAKSSLADQLSYSQILYSVLKLHSFFTKGTRMKTREQIRLIEINWKRGVAT